MTKLMAFSITRSDDRRGYIFFDLSAEFSDGQRLLSMSHDTRFEALMALGQAVARADLGLKVDVRPKVRLKQPQKVPDTEPELGRKKFPEPMRGKVRLIRIVQRETHGEKQEVR